jgi:EAL domain-containing protein (putative c-di-GMP-specific phosphodiesterase class I)
VSGGPAAPGWPAPDRALDVADPPVPPPDPASTALAVVDDSATILRVTETWIGFTRARGGPLGVGDDYLDVFRDAPSAAGVDALIPAGIARVLRGESPAFRCEYPHAAAGRRWLIGVDCRPLPGAATPAFVCEHAHVASAAGEGQPGAFEVALAHIGDGLRRLEAVLRTMGPPGGARAHPARIASILADVATGAAAGEVTSLRRRLSEGPAAAEVTLHVSPGPFGGAPVARGTIAAADDPAPTRADEREGRPGRDPAAAVQGMSDDVEVPVTYGVTPLPGEHGGSVVVVGDAKERPADGARRHGERAHAAIVARVRQALAHDDLVLHAQPVYDLRSMRVHTHELLIRMREPGGGLRSPASFLPVAERSGLIVEIDEWVIRQAAGLAARGHDVSLNVSAASVGTPGFAESVAEVLEEAGADPRRVIMELTETAVVRDERPAREFIDAMRALGCEFALDDFGTGYGGFTYIKQLAIDYLKIDREFVRDLDRDTASRHVVEVIVSLAGRFGLRTVAEGVESRACLEVLAALGVDHAQGYHLRRPAPLARAFAESGA